MCTPSGHVFSREAILENLLEQKKANKRRLAAWEAQQQEQTRKVPLLAGRCPRPAPAWQLLAPGPALWQLLAPGPAMCWPRPASADLLLPTRSLLTLPCPAPLVYTDPGPRSHRAGGGAPGL